MAHDKEQSLERAMRNLDEISTLLREQEHNVVQLQAQLENLSRQQHAVNDSITQTKWQLAQLRSQYAQVVRNLKAHSSSLDRLAFIMSATSFKQAWKRASYLRQLSAWRKTRSKVISNALGKLNSQQEKLNKLAETRRSSLMACNATRVALQRRLQEATAQAIELRNNAPQLTSVVKEKQQQAERLDQSLDRINATQTARAENTTKQYVLEKASLPHPVTGRHTITSHYGKQSHPTLKYVSTVNSGIDITCSENHATAIAVEAGTVSGIYDQGDNCIVMLRHGDYLTVYAGLSQIAVKKGQQVTARQALGDIAIDQTTKRPVLHFELRNGHTPLNPEVYLKQ